MVICWSCLISAFTFPIFLGFVGRSKRIQAVLDANLSQVEKLAVDAAANATWDYGFWIIQLHMCWMVGSLIMWNHYEIAGSTGATLEKKAGAAGKAASMMSSTSPSFQRQPSVFGKPVQRRSLIGPLRVDPKKSEAPRKSSSAKQGSPRKASPSPTPRRRATQGAASPRSALNRESTARSIGSSPRRSARESPRQRALRAPNG